MAKTKFNHMGRVIKQKTLHNNNLLPGMVLKFLYNKKGVFDVRPIVLFLYQEKDLIHTINFNYLHEYKVQELFDRAIQMFGNKIDDAFKREKFFNLNEEFVRIGFSNKLAPSDADGREFYDRVVKPRYFTAPSTKDCYRTYNINSISQLKIVDYEINTLEQYLSTGKYNLFGENIEIEN